MNTLAITLLPPNAPTSAHAVFPAASLVYIIGFFVVVVLCLLVFIAMARKILRPAKAEEPAREWDPESPDPGNASAFMTASMQGVIEKLRAQEKELARLHALAQERAQES